MWKCFILFELMFQTKKKGTLFQCMGVHVQYYLSSYPYCFRILDFKDLSLMCICTMSYLYPLSVQSNIILKLYCLILSLLKPTLAYEGCTQSLCFLLLYFSYPTSTFSFSYLIFSDIMFVMTNNILIHRALLFK